MIKEETLVLCLCTSAQVSTVQACRGGYKLTAAFDVVLKKKLSTLIGALHLLEIRSLSGGPVLCLETHNRTERIPLFSQSTFRCWERLQQHREEAGVNWVRWLWLWFHDVSEERWDERDSVRCEENKKKKKSKTELLLCWDLGLESVYCFNCGGTVSVSIPRY